MSDAFDPAAVPAEIVAAMGAIPNEEQWRAISMPLEPFVIVAGAGSGKTSVMAARVVHLALVALGRTALPRDDGVLPGNVLCLTFTVKATQNLTLRVRRALSAIELPEGEEPAVMNYHAFAAELLERHGLMAGIEPGQRVLSPVQRAELCARVLDEMTFDHVRAEWQPSLIDSILVLADQMANHRVTPQQVIDFNRSRLEQLQAYRSDKAYTAALERIELAEAVARFQGTKESMGAIDFGDQITKALEVAERFGTVRDDARARFRAVLLDEYQDTNVAQADLLHALFGDGFPVTAVGDPDQNIYQWRGASLYNLLEFPRQFPRANGEPAAKLPLYTNFRSGARILAAADTVIAPVPPTQRPDPSKRLVAWPRNGDGAVQLVKQPDEWAEARWIAERVADLRAQDPASNPWSSFAVLCRKSRLFGPLQEAFAEASIPAEFVGLAGLLRIPEVVETLAYARAVADPERAGVAQARILLGPRYRVGFKDLARVGAWAKDRNVGLREEDAHEETPAFLFAEAVEHLDQVEYLSDEGRARLEEFRDELASLRAEARRPVAEFLAEVIRRTGLLAELEASTDVERAAQAKRNLAAFLDEVHAFSPLEGELTLAAFLDHVDAVQAGDAQDASPVQPSGQDSVKVMTVHQAKGLEFDTVFVPGLAEGLLPDLQIQHNPVERGKSLDFELRGDRDLLPSFERLHRVLSKFKEALREQERVEERRTLYVAVTRPRARLFVSGAHWYGDDVSRAKKESAFLRELMDWGESTGLAMVDRGGEAAEVNPIAGYRQRFVRDWPGPARPVEADPLFVDGWRRGAVEAAVSGGSGRVAGGLAADQLVAFQEESDRLRVLAGHLVEREVEPPPPVRAPATVPATGVAEYLRCPKRFYWSFVRPLPRFSGPAARIGTQIHAWIERQASGQASLLELEEAPDLADEELVGEPGRVERLRRTFLASRFGQATPLFAERAFLLHVDGHVVGGRIDAIFGDADGRWEVVDYKTGRKPEGDDPLSGLQLDVYALACVELFGKRAEDLTLTYFYLSSGEEVTRQAGEADATRARVARALQGMDAAAFEPTPGEHCRWCDFRPFCQVGRAYLAAQEPETA